MSPCRSNCSNSRTSLLMASGGQSNGLTVRSQDRIRRYVGRLQEPAQSRQYLAKAIAAYIQIDIRPQQFDEFFARAAPLRLQRQATAPTASRWVDSETAR